MPRLEEIFLEFAQADASTTREFGGTGLGLTICKQLANLMNGSIEVWSTPGIGSVFEIVLEVDEVQPGAALPEPARSALRKPLQRFESGQRVLLVEDNPVNRLVATQMLRLLNLEVIQAENGVEALERLSRHHFDLVLMDGHMPRMDGLQATLDIRAGKGGVLDPRIPIVAMTAQAMRDDRQRFLAAGMDDYLEKPVRIEALGKTLGRFLALETRAVA